MAPAETTEDARELTDGFHLVIDALKRMAATPSIMSRAPITDLGHWPRLKACRSFLSVMNSMRAMRLLPAS